MKYPLTIPILVFASVFVGCRDKLSTKPPPSNLRLDEEILFFPTYGRYDHELRVWRFDVHGKVFEPEYGSTKRAALLAVLRASADAGLGADDTAFRDDRVEPFLVDNERGKSVTIKVDGQQFTAGTSEANGHFSKSLALNADPLRVAKGKNRIQDIEAVLHDSDSRTFTGRVHLIAPHGVSVISDIDDTIKYSQVTDKSQLLKNTFLREFRAVDGMSKLYASLANSGVAFHYVSGSPWQLYQPLEVFMSDAGFPKGSFHLKQFRLKDSSAADMLSSQKETKLSAIAPLLNSFPKRYFILIGDSGEQDPEIYAQIARENPSQIIGIFIRNVTGEKIDNERFSSVFQSVPRDRRALFDDVTQITEQIINQTRNFQKDRIGPDGTRAENP